MMINSIHSVTVWSSVVRSKEDVTQTMYVGQSTRHTNNVTTDKSSTPSDKVDSVCEAVKCAIQTVDEDRWLDQ